MFSISLNKFTLTEEEKNEWQVGRSVKVNSIGASGSAFEYFVKKYVDTIVSRPSQVFYRETIKLDGKEYTLTSRSMTPDEKFKFRILDVGLTEDGDLHVMLHDTCTSYVYARTINAVTVKEFNLGPWAHLPEKELKKKSKFGLRI